MGAKATAYVLECNFPYDNRVFRVTERGLGERGGGERGDSASLPWGAQARFGESGFEGGVGGSLVGTISRVFLGREWPEHLQGGEASSPRAGIAHGDLGGPPNGKSWSRQRGCSAYGNCVSRWVSDLPGSQ